MKRIIICSIVLLLFVNFPAIAFQNKPGLSLEGTFKIYVNAIHNSDIKTLFSTVTYKRGFYCITSRGELFKTLKEYYDIHSNRFKEENREMPVELIEVYEEKDFGYTIAVFHYKRKTQSGRKYNLDSYFTMIFHKEDGMWKAIADICTPIKEYFSEKDKNIEYDVNQAYLLNVIKNRRTVRKFKPTPVPEEHIMKILDAARFAPTAGNQQPWKFLVVRDRERLNRLKNEALLWYVESYEKRKKPADEEINSIKEKLGKILDNVLSAPVYIAVLVDSKAKYPDYVIYDGTLAVGNLMIAARALGYGTGFFTTFFPEDKMKKFFKIPDRYRLICFTPVGVPEKWPDTPPKKDLKEMVVFESF